MATIKRNRIDGYELIVTPNYVRETEPVIVEGLTAGDDMIWRATMQGGIPQPGDPHAYLPNCKVAEIKGGVIDTTTARLTITSESVDAETQPPIGSGSGWVISNDVSLVQAQSEIDRDGRPFVVSWEVKGSSKGHPDRVARAPVYIAMRTLTASTTRTSIPPDQWYGVTNCVNGQAWYGGHRGEWLFAGVKDSTRDGGKTYSVQLTFIHNPESWVTVALYYDEHGQAVAISDQDAARAKNGVYERWKGNGISKGTFYREADFASIFNLSRR